MTHEDSRRIIHDWAQGDFKSLKCVFVKSRTPIGDHYHKNKSEVFFLALGNIEKLVLGDEITVDIKAPYVINVPPNTYHKFICSPGSIIFGGATELFDPNDEIKR